MNSLKIDPQEPIRLLLIDNDINYLNVLSRRLGRRNMNVVSTVSGSRGIQVLRKEDFDTAVVDLKTEDVDGLELVKIFKKMAPAMPVILLAGHGSEHVARQGLILGAVDYLTKPCDLEELVEKIREAVAGGTGSQVGRMKD
ncbi:MAG: response regulator [Deltaproteobacteria bacterium]|nr:response regulator [Deltaproteobacteria bacterium]